MPRRASVWMDSCVATPLAIDIAWLAVVVSDALTMSSASAGAPLCRLAPNSRSMTSPTLASAESSAP